MKTARDNIPERIEGIKCSKCGSIEMNDLTGLTEEDISLFKECPYICRRCQENLYPVYFGQEEEGMVDDSGIHNKADD